MFHAPPEASCSLLITRQSQTLSLSSSAFIDAVSCTKSEQSELCMQILVYKLMLRHVCK